MLNLNKPCFFCEATVEAEDKTDDLNPKSVDTYRENFGRAKTQRRGR
jgi:hypothetical protein